MRAPLVALLMLLTPGLAAAQQAAVTINGRPLSAHDREVIAKIERSTGQPTQPGAYWYDDATGALGLWGGPTLMFLAPGLGLGGKLPPHASGGGQGSLTGIFINGREIHPTDVQSLTSMLGVPPAQGRWWVDAQGNAGREGGPALFNLFAVARQNGRSPDAYYRKNGARDSTYVKKGCAAVHGHTGSGDDKRDYSYYVGCE